MTRPANSSGKDDKKYLAPPEFLGGTPWLVDMDDGQRKAHTKQMDANANKIQAEANSIKIQNGWERLKLGFSYIAVFGFVFILGFGAGILFWISRG